MSLQISFKVENIRRIFSNLAFTGGLCPILASATGLSKGLQPPEPPRTTPLCTACDIYLIYKQIAALIPKGCRKQYYLRGYQLLEAASLTNRGESRAGLGRKPSDYLIVFFTWEVSQQNCLL